MYRALVTGAGGFIGGHLVKRLKSEGYWVRGVDQKQHEFAESLADEFVVADLRDQSVVRNVVAGIDEVYQLAADMGGAGYIFTGDHDAVVMHNSATINLNVLEYGHKAGVKKFFYSSSACIYPEYNQRDPNNPKCSEDSAYPAAPDSEYGWEKLFSERLYFSYQRNYGVEVRVARFHNIFGPEGTWRGGREKAPAALCRKVAEASEGGEIEIWGDGEQTRSFLYVDECVEGVRRLMQSRFRRTREYRFRGDGNHQPACRDDHEDCGQKSEDPAHSRPTRSSRPQFRQSLDSSQTEAGRRAGRYRKASKAPTHGSRIRSRLPLKQSSPLPEFS